MEKIRAIYPRIRWGTVSQSQTEAAEDTQFRRGCDGVVATYNQYQAWRTNASFCKLEVAQVMAPARGHWLTNRQSWCVAAALNYAIAEMDITGDLELRIAKYFPKLSCGEKDGAQMDDHWQEAESVDDTASEEEAGSGDAGRRRRLSKKDATTATTHNRRRLSSAGGGGGGGGGGGVPKMEILDFLGMFIIWMIVTAWMLLWTCTPLAAVAPPLGYGTALVTCAPPPLRALPPHSCALRGSVADAIPDKCKANFRKLFVRTVTLGQDDGSSADQVDVNNDSLVLREVLKQLGEIREQQKTLTNGSKKNGEEIVDVRTE